MGKFIHTSAGYGGVLGTSPTDKFAVKGTDLGFLFEGGKTVNGGKPLWVGGVFGDTFDKKDPHVAGGKIWHSPVLGRSSNTNFLDKGITWDNFAGARNTGGVAKEIWPGRRGPNHGGRLNSGNFNAFTIIPNDIIQVEDGRYFGMGFRVNDWDKDSGQAMCHTISNSWWWSDEPHAENWQVGRFAKNLNTLYEWGAHEGRNKYFQNASFLMMPGDNRLYVFGSREGRKIGFGDQADGVYLRRAHYDQCFAHDTWEYFGYSGGKWQWGKNVQPTPIIKPLTPGSWIGELNAQYIDGRVVVTYSDSTRGAVAHVSDRPDGVYSAPTVLVSRIQSNFQYAPSAHPWSPSLEDAYLHLSSWAQIPATPVSKARSINYCTQGYRVSLVSDKPSTGGGSGGGIIGSSLLGARGLPQITETSPARCVDTEALTEAQCAAYTDAVLAASKEANAYLDTPVEANRLDQEVG